MNILASPKQLIDRLKNKRWNAQIEKEIQNFAKYRYELEETSVKNTHAQHLVFICEEFFHNDLRGYGGFGKTVKNIAEHYNALDQTDTKAALAYPLSSQLIPVPTTRIYHNTPVVLMNNSKFDITRYHQYADLLSKLNPKVLISIDWYPSYSLPAYACSATPLLIWIHDPRDTEEWEKIAAVPDELKFRGAERPEELLALAEQKRQAIESIFNLEKTLPRKVIFCTTAKSLVPRAERTYGIAPIKAHWLPNPIEIPNLETLVFSPRPSLLYLGRLDAVKRPWIAFELAKRNPDVDFLIAGKAHNVGLMEPWIDKYKHLPNLKLLGHVDGEQKDELLRNCWAILNTSVHEAEPVSFLEAFAYGKCVVGCHDPDEEVSRFGYYTGEVLGEGLDEESLSRFNQQIRKLVSNEEDRMSKGWLGRNEMIQNHTFESFKSHLNNILKTEGVI